MKLNVQITLDKYEERDDLEELNTWILSYNMMSSLIPELKPIQTEVCDNGDGTIEFRLVDYEFSLKDLENSNKVAQEYMKDLDLQIAEMMKNLSDK